MSRIVSVVFLLVSVGAIVAGVGARFAREKAAAASRASGLRERRESANLPPEVPVIHPVAIDYAPHISITGMLDPVQEANLSFNATGRLASIEVRLGQQVTAGQLIASLDRRSIAAQSAVASAAIDASNAQLAMAQDRLRRLEALSARGATSDADLESARQQLALATAQLGQAQAQTRVISSDGSNHQMRAPFAGTITRVPEGIGNVVGPGQALFRIEDLSRLVMHTGITERVFPFVAIGNEVSLELAPNARGHVRAYVHSLDPVTRRAPIEIEFPNDAGALVGHQLMKGRLHSTRTLPSMRVPATAIRADQTVFVVDGENRVQTRRVQSMVDDDGSGIVLFGLTPNDRVVVRPTPDLAPGAAVRPTSPSSERR